MKNGQLKSFRDMLMGLESFKSLPKVVQKITLARNNVKHIENGYNVAKNIGFDKWQKEFHYSHRNQMLVEELLKLDQ